MRTIFFLILLFFSSNLRSGETGQRQKPAEKEHANKLKQEAIFGLQKQHCYGSTIVALPNKDLLCAWFQGSGERTADDVAILGSRFNHKTQSWSKPFVMADTPEFPDINPVLFVDQQSRLWLVWYTVVAYQWSSSILKFRISSDFEHDGPPVWKWQDILLVKADGSPANGITATDPFVIALKKKYEDYFASLKEAGQISENGATGFKKADFEKAVRFYTGIASGQNLLGDGSEKNEAGETIKKQLGYPLMRRIGWQTRNKPLLTGQKILLPLYSDGLNLSLIAITDDGGLHWRFSEPILGGGAIQPSLVKDADGALSLLMRDNGPAPKRLMFSKSTDDGITWNTVTDTDIPNPGTAADQVVLKSGNRALVLNDIEEGRHRLSVWLSTDEGKTWPYKKVLVDGKPNSAVRGHYPAIIQGADGMIHICYTNQTAGNQEHEELKNIVHASFTEQWIMQ